MVFANPRTWSGSSQLSFRLPSLARWSTELNSLTIGRYPHTSPMLSDPLHERPEELRIWQEFVATTLSGLDEATAWTRSSIQASEYISEEDVIAALVSNNHILKLMPEDEFRVEIEVSSIEEWVPRIIGPEYL